MTIPFIHHTEYSHVTVSKAVGDSDLESSKTFYLLCVDCPFLYIQKSKIQKFKKQNKSKQHFIQVVNTKYSTQGALQGAHKQHSLHYLKFKHPHRLFYVCFIAFEQ